MFSVVFASNNLHKLLEVKQAFTAKDWDIKSQADFKVPSVAETGLTFVENALIKARHAAAYTELPVLADDSGLVVPALQGAPGVYSARYAGEHATAADNNAKLLAALTNYQQHTERRAYFVCVMVLLQHAADPLPVISIGNWHGEIAFEASGHYGHGYDPIFYDPKLGRTAAELPLELKNTYSHRAKALHRLYHTITKLHQ